MDYRGRNNILGNFGNILNGSGGGGLLSALSALGGGGNAGGLLSLLGNMGGGSNPNPLALLNTLSSLGGGGGGGDGNSLAALSTLFNNFKPPPQNTNPAAAAFSGNQGFNPGGPPPGIDTSALMNRLSSLIANLENTAATQQKSPNTAPFTPPQKPAGQKNPPAKDNEEPPIIDAATGLPESPPGKTEAKASGEAPPMGQGDLKGILSLLSSALANQNGGGQTTGGAYAPGGNFNPNLNPYPPQYDYNQNQPPYPPQGNYPPQGWYGNRPGPFRQYPSNQNPYRQGNTRPQGAGKPPIDYEKMAEEPYSPCANCNNPRCRHLKELPSFAQVKEMAANWRRY